MNDSTHQPAGLTQQQLARLEEHVRRGQLLSPERLLQAAYAHLEDVQEAHVQHPEVDAAMAEAICHALDRVVAQWETFSPAEQSWLRGALRYFTKREDHLPDFRAGGFRDDLEVLNACLKFAHREELIVSLDVTPRDQTDTPDQPGD